MPKKLTPYIIQFIISILVANFTYAVVKWFGLDNALYIKLFFVVTYLILYISYVRTFKRINRVVLESLTDIENVLAVKSGPRDQPITQSNESPSLLMSRIEQLLFYIHTAQDHMTALEKITDAKSKTLETITKVSHQYLEHDHVTDYYHLILASAIQVIENASKGSILVLDPSTNRYKYQTCVGYDLEILKNVDFSLEQTFLTEYTKEGANIVASIENHDRAMLSPEQYALIKEAGGYEIFDVLSAPIFIDGVLYAILNIDSDQPNAFDNIDLQLIQFFTAQISLALKNKFQIEETVKLSKYDRLTGVYNRNYLEQYLQKQYGDTLKSYDIYTLVLCDLDNLKVVNDTYGHSAGDEVLKSFAAMLTSEIRTSDFLARIGGDEFVILFYQMNYRQTAQRMATIFESSQDRTITYNGNTLPIRFSYGIASSPDDSMVYSILHKIADQRMYDFKKTHKHFDVNVH
ncbi:diguanylate cyclase [Fusibacter paucivorans]|uniref:Diguanylate cyclase n=1 Tax=Fusibacter paucivorans TaxID=76009 RepID=A0ABS5PSF5_9FIRM|nr:sensor domain-containing diguanylate cyclase [Fusibacter paucivorans]MBS7527301.1 diguanylate cyclase [Fusibacter paucivorans]